MYQSDITGRSYSKADFLTMLEKRVRKHLRMHELVQDGGTYWFTSPHSLAAQYLKHVLQHIFGTRIVFAPHGELLDSQTLDEWISGQVTAVMQGENFTRNTQVKPLLVVSTKELLQASEILTFSGTPPQKTHPFIQQLHDLYPQTKSSFLKSFLYIEELEKSTKKD